MILHHMRFLSSSVLLAYCIGCGPKPVLISQSEYIPVGPDSINCALYSTGAMSGFKVVQINSRQAAVFDMSDDLFLSQRNDSAIVYSRWEPKRIRANSIPTRFALRCYDDMSFRSDAERDVVRLICKNSGE
jgi:hypothetical protein